jgi:multidrug efflux pump subunit AcrB
LSSVYVGVLSLALRHRVATILLAVAMFVVTMRLVPPLVGKEMMPPMDTGISIISFNTQPSMIIDEVEKVVDKVEAIIKSNKHVVQISTVVGSEPGQISFGGGGKTAQSVTITTRMIPRNERKETIWEVNDDWRKKITRVPGIRDLMVTEYGSTPVSTTKAPLDVIISGPSGKVLDKLADEVVARLKTVKGLRDIRRSWRRDKPQYRIEPDHLTCAAYGVEPKRVGQEVKATLKGYIVGSFDLKTYLSIPIRVRYDERDVDSPWKLEDIYIPTKSGYKQLRTLATIEKRLTRPIITRENQRETIDVTAANHVITIGHAANRVEKRLADLKLPAGYSIDVSGTISNMAASNKRMVKALKVGLVLLFVLLLPMFRSFTHPFTIMAAIPLAVAGAFWGLLIFNKPMCKPAMMGIIFLGGTIVNNSILLLDFIIQARSEGMGRHDAIIRAVKVRMRPILMTTVSTVVGLLPLIFEMAVGLERMSPLGIVAACGLIAGTILTIVVIPVVYTIMDDISAKLSGRRHA